MSCIQLRLVVSCGLTNGRARRSARGYKWIGALQYDTMGKLCPFGSKKRNRYAKAGAAVGAGAGARVGPFATGLSAGLGGAVGYLAGSAVDAATGDVSAVTPLPDGGQEVREGDRTARDDGGVIIPVDDESDA